MEKDHNDSSEKENSTVLMIFVIIMRKLNIIITLRKLNLQRWNLFFLSSSLRRP